MKGTYDIWLRRLFLFASAILATACHSHTQEKKEQETHEHGNEAILLSAEKAKEMGLRTITLERGDFTETIKAAGRILPGQGDEQALLARTPGILHYAGPRIAEGQAVKKGEVLFTLSDSLLVEGQISVRIRTAYEKAAKAYARAKDLNQAQALSDKELEQAEAEYRTARAAFQALGGKDGNRGVTVKAPFDGYLKNIQAEEGEYVESGQKLATIAQQRKLRLRFDVPIRYAAQLPLIRTAGFRTAYDDSLYHLSALGGRLLSFARSTDDAAFLPLVFEFNNKEEKFMPGLFIEGFLWTRPMPDCLSVPVEALLEEEGLYAVFLQVKEDSYVKREVKPGLNNGEAVQIKEGLEAGDRVVVKGARQLKLASQTSTLPAHQH